MLLGGIIKRNKNLVHLDLSATGLTVWILKELGSAFKRAPALLAVHLTNNPGLTSDQNFDLTNYMSLRMRCRPKENIPRFLRIQKVVSELVKSHELQRKSLSKGIVAKMQKN